MKLLVANRSEIACRVFQACREMGIRTVAIVAPGDEDARHVTYADEVQAVSNYLDVDAIIQAAKKSNASLIHPGYGFLSERPVFARAVEAAGIVFVGPRAETMEIMGDKIAAKQLAAEENVQTLPWVRAGQGSDIKTAAKMVGYPILLKASAGGGGKGMRLVENEQQIAAMAESASAEALAAFGDGTLFLERFIKKPRHIEVQVFGDGLGGGVHLHERDCSLQRRHQKLWEEAPAVNIPSCTRSELFEAALRMVKRVKYRNAGTVEFLVDTEGGFYFLEMNTRLQVEHPVTEMITGIDIVQTQIAQALSPDKAVLCDVPEVSGHAIEVRLYAEDPLQGFIPSPGIVERLIWPSGAGIRIESGIEEGQLIGTQFDSLLGKIVVHAQTRQQALARLRFALEGTVILGVGTNQSYLRALAADPSVLDWKVCTDFLDNEFYKRTQKFEPSDNELLTLAAVRAAGRVLPFSMDEKHFPSPWSIFGSRQEERGV
ncbi:MAG: biotin carboxylase N-terminal domain-containing protein [Bdellovibrionota bacterium]